MLKDGKEPMIMLANIFHYIPWVTGSFTLAPQARRMRMSSRGAQRMMESANSLWRVCKHGNEGILSHQFVTKFPIKIIYHQNSISDHKSV